MKPAILIHGPTASGKTALSIDVARKYDGEIVNADSMQVYSELKVISARPDEAEMDGIPHHIGGLAQAKIQSRQFIWYHVHPSSIRLSMPPRECHPAAWSDLPANLINVTTAVAHKVSFPSSNADTSERTMVSVWPGRITSA